jgi:GNAT superfamily N-acetyltransferase
MFRETGDLSLCYIKPNWQRRGIGSAIVRAIEGHAHEAGHREIHLLSSHDAQQFWSHHGYVRRGEATPAFGIVWDIPFRKKLSTLVEA